MNSFLQLWDRVWFKPDDCSAIDVMRVLLGVCILVCYVSISPNLMDLYGNQGWVSREALTESIQYPWIWSIHYYFHETWHFVLFHYVFLIASLFFLIGLKTNWVKWIVLIGHVSYAYRNPGICYGVDNILASLIFLLCLAPVGRYFSIDSVLNRHKSKKVDLNNKLKPSPSSWGFACLRLIQIQMVALYFFSAVEKLQGETWWAGDALWLAVNNYEFTNISVGWLADHYWLINVMTYATIGIELAYTFLIWGRQSRPYFLIAALVLHLGIAIILGLYLFAAVMTVGHLAFIRSEWISKICDYWKVKIGSIEMIYDGDCGFCKRSMAWFLAFDGLNQIKVRNFRTDSSLPVSSDKLEKALYLIDAKGIQLPGFYAYRHAVLRVPGLWWMIPFFYVPYISKFIGVPIYNWIASNRNLISKCVIDNP